MSQLIAIAFERKISARKILEKVRKLQRKNLIELEDAVVVTHEKEGNVALSQSVNMAALGALSGAGFGMMFGFIMGGVVPMLVCGFLAIIGGAMIGSMLDYGIDDKFVREVGKTLKLNTSAVILLVKKLNYDRALEEITGKEGRMIKIALSEENKQTVTK